MAVSACGSSTPAKAKTSKSSTGPAGTATQSAATNSEKHLNTNTIAVAIEASIEQEKHIKARVTCPEDVLQKQGLTFSCIATTYSLISGKKVPIHTTFTVTQRNDLGNVYYSSPS